MAKLFSDSKVVAATTAFFSMEFALNEVLAAVDVPSFCQA